MDIVRIKEHVMDLKMEDKPNEQRSYRYDIQECRTRTGSHFRALHEQQSVVLGGCVKGGTFSAARMVAVITDQRNRWNMRSLSHFSSSYLHL